MITRANRVIAPPVWCYALWSESTAPRAMQPRRSKIKASKIVRSCPKKTNERGDVVQVKGRVERDRLHVENSPLSEIGGSRGARESFGKVGRKRLGIQLDSFDDLLFFI